MECRFNLVATRYYQKAKLPFVLRVTFFSLLFLPLSLSAADTMEDQATFSDVVAVVPAHFPPHYSLDQRGKPSGFAIDAFNEIVRIAGLNVKYIVRETWMEVDQTMRDGRADLIPNLGITEERQQHYNFNGPMEIISSFDIFPCRDKYKYKYKYVFC